MTRAHAALLPDGRRLHLQDGPIDLVIEAFGSAAAVQAAYAAAMRRFDGLLDELCAELPALRAAARPEGTALVGPVARRMYEAVVEHAAGMAEVGTTTDVPASLGGEAAPFSRSREKSLPRTCSGVPEGRMRARPAEPGGEAGKPAAVPHSAVPPSAVPFLGVFPGLVPGTHSSPRPPTSHLPRPRMGSRHKAGNDFGEGGALPYTAAFITPMAAVAGAVADEILAAMLAWAAPEEGTREHAPLAHASLSRAYVNNGGDIALFLAPGERFAIGLVDRPDRPSLDAAALFARTQISADDGIGGIATSGWRGRSFSLGIADAVTVLAATAAAADAAATIVANAVDLPGHPAIVRVPARDLQPDSDLGDRRVTRGVGVLTAGEIDAALAAGVAVAEDLCRRGLIAGAALHLAGATRVVGIRLAGVVEDAGITLPRATIGPAGGGASAGRPQQPGAGCGGDHEAAVAVSPI